jgi:hypothetical protein
VHLKKARITLVKLHCPLATEMYTAAQQQDWTTDTTIYPPLDKISNLWKTGRENIDS